MCVREVSRGNYGGNIQIRRLLPVKTPSPTSSPAILAMGVRDILAVHPELLKYHFLYLIKKKLVLDTHMITANLTRPIVPWDLQRPAAPQTSSYFGT